MRSILQNSSDPIEWLRSIVRTACASFPPACCTEATFRLECRCQREVQITVRQRDHNRRHVPPGRPWQLSFITLKMRSASELEATCTKTLGRSCVQSCMKDTGPGAPDRKGADCCEQSDIMMCEVRAWATCDLVSEFYSGVGCIFGILYSVLYF